GPAELTLQSGSALWLTGTSTLHDYEAKASQLSVTFRSDPAKWPADRSGADAIEALIRARGVTAIDVVVGVAGLKSGKDGLDKTRYKPLLAERHPEIRFHSTSYEVAEGDSAGMAIATTGLLTVAGTEREITLHARARRAGDQVRLTADVPLLMTQFGIKPPK